MKLWNFKTETYDDNVTTITDTNALNYVPVNKISENQYAFLRNQGEQPIQALTAILNQHDFWN